MKHYMQFFGKFLIFFGILLIILGAILIITPKIPFLGKLPGDIYYRKENFTFYFPLATSLLLSLILTILLNLFLKK